MPLTRSIPLTGLTQKTIMAEDNKPDEPLEMDPMEPANKADDAAVASLNFAEDDALREDVEEPTDLEDGAVAEPEEFDVISGRGASVNAHSGNKKFRALCKACLCVDNRSL